MNRHLLGKTATSLFLLSMTATVVCQSRTAEVKIDPTITYQYIEGFGTSVIDYGDTPGFFDDPKLYDLAVNDLGMSILRLSFPQEMEETNDDDDPNHFNWPAFHMPYLERRMKIALEFKKRGLDRFVFSTWSPSSFIKTNRSTVQGGYVRMDMYEEYAENVAACILAAKQNWGIDVGAFSVQNELMFIEPYKSCLYNPYSVREAVRALKRKFKREHITTRIQLPEDMMFFDRMYAYILPTMEDSETSGFKGDFCTHRQQEWDEVVKWKEATARFGRQTWMTETSGHKADWDGAMKMAADMYDYLVGGNMSAWLYWQLSDRASSSDYALMNGTEPNCKYYAAKHFYKWIRPGAYRVEAVSEDPELKTAAFRHDPNGSLTLVLMNYGEQDKTVTIDVGGSYKHASFRAFRSGKDEKWIESTTPVKERLVIPARYIVTLYATNPTWKKGTFEFWPEACPLQEAPDKRIGSFASQETWAEGVLGNVVRYQNLEGVKKYLSGNGIDKETGNGWTALFWAITAGRADVVEWLIEQHADINHLAKDGWTPLHAAAATFVGGTDGQGNKATKRDILQLLLRAGADPKKYTEEGFSPLHVAVMNEHVAWQQSEEDGLGRIKDLIDAGLNPDEPDHSGKTALHWAAWQVASNGLRVSPAVVSFLLTEGADANARDKEGRTPLHYACMMGYPDILLALVQHNADLNIRDKEGKTAADWLRAKGYDKLEVVLTQQKLPEETVPVETPKGNGYLGAELVKATRDGNVEEVRRLLGLGADKTYRDSDGFSAYDRARDNHHRTLMDLLK